MSQNNSDRLNTRVSVIALAACLALSPLAAEAAGLGRLTVLSALGQPLRAEIELSATGEEMNGMTAKVASADSFKQAGLEYFSALSSIRFAIDKRPNGQPVVRMTSDRPISEPFVDMLVELNWSSGRLVREYTFLLDPPEARPLAAAAEPVVPPVTAPLPAPVRPAPVPAPVASRPAPAPAPAPSPTAQPKPAAVAAAAEPSAEVYRVKRGDTLAKVAQQTRPEGVSLEQMLVGLLASNRDAFIDGNMNRLKAGRILQVPAKDQVAAVPQEQAVKEVRAQAADWNAYRRKLAALAAEAPAQETESRQQAAGKVTAKVEEPAAPAEAPKDQVKVSKTQEAAAKAPAAGAKPAEEDRIAAERAAKESQERVAALEKNVADLKKLSEMKSGDAAAPQPAEGAKAVPATPAEPAAAPAAGEAAAPAVQAPKVADKPKRKPPVVVQEEEEESFLGSLFGNPLVLGGLAAIVAAVGGLAVYRRRKGQSGESAAMATGTLSQPSLGANSVFRATGGQSVDTSNVAPATTDFSQSGAGAIDTDDVDPVAEAEVYMAYGRDAQAEEILLDALQKDPKRIAIHVKLLEIYFNRKSAKQFETLATELYAQTGGKGAEWEKAIEMGGKLDPSNPLYAGAGAGAGAVAAGVGAAAAAGLATGLAGEAFNADATMVVSPGKFDQSTLTMPSASASTGGGDLGLDVVSPTEVPVKSAFEFDLGSFGATPAVTETPALETGGKAADDFLASLSASTNALDLSGLAGKPAVAPAFEAPAETDNGLNFEITSLNLAAEPASAPAPAPEELSLGDGMKLDFDFGSASNAMPDADAAPGGADVDIQLTSSAFEPNALNAGMAGSGLGLEVQPAAEAGDDFEQTLLVTPGIAAEMATAPGTSVSEQEVATKIDLAKAYEEMGDAEGARELLQEVLAEGSAAQRETAQAMIDRLG